MDLVEEFGAIDIYLFDQALKGRFAPGMRLLDAGCGSGRNLVFFLRQGFDVCGLDPWPQAVEQTRALAARLAPALPAANFRAEALETASFPDAAFDAVVCSAVLHFAENPGHFRRMVDGAWRMLKPGGFFFARLASTIGLEDRVRPLGEGRYRLPDGTDRYLVDEAALLRLTEELGGTLAEPLKTTNVQGQRAMTTWCATKR
ncbi:MAG: methyltransferase domain-containing protein [Vicinamibacteria bacterium]|nr:methyltransferase domain-containing protein [Vicinamibacteria bacterium]